MTVKTALYGAHIKFRLEVQVEMNPQFLASSDDAATKQAEQHNRDFIKAVEELSARFASCTVRVKQLPDA